VTNEQHNRYIAYAFFANAGFYFLIILFMIAMFSALFFGTPGDPGPPAGFFVVMMAFLSIIYSLFALPSLIAGYALLKKKSWARTASIVAGVVAGMNMPVGTAACVYALWFFFSENWKEVYPEDSISRPAELKQIAYGVESQRAAYAEEELQPKFDPYNPPDWR
jgi:hypothetical protein